MQQTSGQNIAESKKYKVINESEQYSLQVYEINHKDKLPIKYWKGYEKFYPSLKNGDIGIIDFEFDHPNGLKLVIFKVDGFEDKYNVIAKNALGNLDDKEISQPKIEWQNFPDTTENLEVELSGKIVANGEIVSFKLNQDTPTLSKQNEFTYKLKLFPGRNAINYSIFTNTKTAIVDFFVIENTSKIYDEIYTKLLKNKLLKFSKDAEKQKEEIDQIKRHLKDGYFYPPELNTFYDIEIGYLVRDGFKSYLTEISNGLIKRGCKSLIGKEYQSWNSEMNSQVENRKDIHWIEFNGKKEIIFKGNLKDNNLHEIYIKKLIELTNKALKESKKQEKVFQITSYDGVFISILTDKEYSLLKEICKPLKNKFVE
jgi:hypothetical protein